MNAQTMKRVALLLGGLALAGLLAGAAFLGQPLKAGAQSQGSTLTAVKVSTPPTIDGDAKDEGWAKGQPLVVPVKEGAIGDITVTLKAVYTDTHLYLLAQWPDKTETIEHHPYTFDGQKWTKPEAPLEDRFAIQWNISVADFERKGCAVLCHTGTKYPDKKPRMHTNAPGEFTDEWHWKAARSNPMGYVDDKYMDSTVKPDDDEASHGADGGTRVYTGNSFKDGVPSFVWKGAPTAPPVVAKDRAALFLMATEKAPYGPINPLTGKPWAKGDKVPVATLQEPAGSNADIKASGRWANGAWILEISRALNTGANAVKGEKKVDVVFEPGKTYHFGISVFDNAEAIDHSFSDVLTLVFR
ncbi:MAG: hypothetical protein HY359_15990 [Candidatus Rokubacteria bacterium]|nr:hypothetical protein [Candidatus Rokubacteria bacterium]